MEKKKEHERIFKSTMPFDKKLQELVPERYTINWSRVDKWKEVANAYLRDMKKQTDNNQLAVAVAALIQLS